MINQLLKNLSLTKKLFSNKKNILNFKNYQHFQENSDFYLKTALEYNKITFSRRILDFIPLIDVIIRKKINLENKEIYSPGSGSCDIEAFLYETVKPKKILCTDIKKPSYLIDTKKINPIKNKNVEFILEDSENKDIDYLRNKKFNFVISTQVLEHVEDCDKYFKNLIDCIKNDGYLFLTTPYLDPKVKITEELREWHWKKHAHYHVGFNINYFQNFEKKLDYKIIEYGPTGFFNQKLFHHTLSKSEIILKDEKCDKNYIKSLMYLQTLFHFQTLKKNNRNFHDSMNLNLSERFSDSIFLLIKKN